MECIDARCASKWVAWPGRPTTGTPPDPGTGSADERQHARDHHRTDRPAGRRDGPGDTGGDDRARWRLSVRPGSGPGPATWRGSGPRVTAAQRRACVARDRLRGSQGGPGRPAVQLRSGPQPQRDPDVGAGGRGTGSGGRAGRAGVSGADRESRRRDVREHGPAGTHPAAATAHRSVHRAPDEGSGIAGHRDRRRAHRGDESRGHRGRPGPRLRAAAAIVGDLRTARRRLHGSCSVPEQHSGGIEPRCHRRRASTCRRRTVQFHRRPGHGEADDPGEDSCPA